MSGPPPTDTTVSSENPADKGQATPAGVVGTEINVLGALYNAIAGAQTLKETVETVQDAANRIDTAKDEIDSAFLKGIDTFSNNVGWGIIWVGLSEQVLEEEMRQFAMASVIKAVRSINLLESIIDPFLARFRQGE